MGVKQLKDYLRRSAIEDFSSWQVTAGWSLPGHLKACKNGTVTPL